MLLRFKIWYFRMKFSSSDLAFLLALASVVFASVAFGFSVCLFLAKYIL